VAKVFKGRYTAGTHGELVVFLIGMRINKPWKLHRWLPVFFAMPRMLASLAKHPEYGLLNSRTFFLPNPVLIQYWRSFEDLERFARAGDDPHLAAWRRFNAKIAKSGDVGIFHETYRVQPETTESVYANMPVTGLAAAISHVPVSRHSARARLDANEPDEPAASAP
jgi:hypothetical protein